MRLRQFAKFMVLVLGVLGIIGAVLNTWYVDIVEVGHNGMAPTLIAGDTVLVWRNAAIDHGDVVLCHDPRNPAGWVLGRVLGRNGTALAVVRGQLTIEGRVLPTDYRDDVDFVDRADGNRVRMLLAWEHLGNDDHMTFARSEHVVRMRPTGDYDGLYLIGDNRTYGGQDSRTFGPVSETSCQGEVFLRIWASPDTPAEIGNHDFEFIN